MKKPITVILAEQTFEIAQLNLLQLRDLNIGVSKTAPTDPIALVRESFDDALETLQIALRISNPEMTVEKMYSMPITEKEMVEAVGDVLRHAGLLKPKEPKPGEEVAAVEAASTGPGFSGDSAPA